MLVEEMNELTPGNHMIVEPVDIETLYTRTHTHICMYMCVYIYF